MMQTGNIYSLNSSRPQESVAPPLPKDQARDYICEMLGELGQMARAAQLNELAMMISVTGRIGQKTD